MKKKVVGMEIDTGDVIYDRSMACNGCKRERTGCVKVYTKKGSSNIGTVCVAM